MVNLGGPIERQRRSNKSRVVTQTIEVGGTKLRFLDQVVVKEGDPTPLKQAKRFYEKIADARRFEWQYRTAMAFREWPKHTAFGS